MAGASVTTTTTTTTTTLSGALVEAHPTAGLPIVRANRGGSLAELVGAEKEFIGEQLRLHGGVLFRGYPVISAELFRDVVTALEPNPLTYVYRSTPRTQIGSGIYTATEYPPRATIPLHCENAYAREWPMRLLFCCVEPAPSGGETPLARMREVTAAIPPDIRKRFASVGVMYVRNYGTVDLSWETVFQTSDRAEVERYCREHSIECEWITADDEAGVSLRTRQVCQGMAHHPTTNELLWFNQANLFHPSALEEATRRALSTLFEPGQYPRNAFYGDGSELEPETLEAVRRAFDDASFSFAWERGDVLLVDNMLLSHGRRPFKGPRKVLVAMSGAHRADPAELGETVASRLP